MPFAGSHNMRCSILEDRVAVWQLKQSSLRLSALAAELLVADKKLKWQDLRLKRHYEWNDFDGPGEPITGVSSALLDTGTGFAKGIGMVPVSMARHIKKREEHEKKKKERAERKMQQRKARESARNHVQSKNDAPLPDEKQRQDRPAAPTHQDTSGTMSSVISADPEHHIAQELATDAGRGLLTSVGAIAAAPLDLGLALAQGFHNAPRLYGDASVRKPVRITGMYSGARAARNEFMYGIYDGWTGVVMQPVHGWQDGPTKSRKMTGLGKGFARGIGGFVLKDVTAIIAPPAMLCQGMRKEFKKRVGGPGTTAFISKAHIIQGEKDLEALKAADKEDGTHELEATQRQVDHGWQTMTTIWKEKEDHLERHGGRIRGRLSLHREERKWAENGALENIAAADRALETKKQGKDLDGVFAQRKKEMKIAEQPRAGAMEQPIEYEEGAGIGPNGHYKHHPRESGTAETMDRVRLAHKGKAKGETAGVGVRNEEQRKEHRKRDPHDTAEDDAENSDTAVESPVDDGSSKERSEPLKANGESGFRSSPAGKLNDMEIDKHHADQLGVDTVRAA